MTILPKRFQVVAVSTTTRPVTQTADVEVKKAFKNPTLLPDFVARGVVKSRAPIIITAKKPKVMYLVGSKR